MSPTIHRQGWKSAALNRKAALDDDPNVHSTARKGFFSFFKSTVFISRIKEIWTSGFPRKETEPHCPGAGADIKGAPKQKSPIQRPVRNTAVTMATVAGPPHSLRGL